MIMQKTLSKYLLGVLFLLGTVMPVNAQIQVYQTFDEFNKARLQDLSFDTTYVVNFWATWCVSCVKELPYFEELNEKYSDQAFKQVLVSLDAPKKIDTKVVPFVKKKNIKSEVVLLADGKYNDWIDLVDPRWSGAIPITLLLRGNEKRFYEQEFHSMEEIETELLKLF